MSIFKSIRAFFSPQYQKRLEKEQLDPTFTQNIVLLQNILSNCSPDDIVLISFSVQSYLDSLTSLDPRVFIEVSKNKKCCLGRYIVAFSPQKYYFIVHYILEDILNTCPSFIGKPIVEWKCYKQR